VKEGPVQRLIILHGEGRHQGFLAWEDVRVIGRVEDQPRKERVGDDLYTEIKVIPRRPLPAARCTSRRRGTTRRSPSREGPCFARKSANRLFEEGFDGDWTLRRN
jgi:hypothetical protein